MDIGQDDIERSVRINIVSATAFAQAAVKAFTAECVISFHRLVRLMRLTPLYELLAVVKRKREDRSS
jgi:hypothetical protein